MAVHAELRTRFRGRPCRAFISDMRVQVDGGRRYVYENVEFSAAAAPGAQP